MICSDCGEQVQELASRSKRCKPCHRLYMREHYQNNKSYYASKARRNTYKKRNEVRQELLQYFISHPCVDCGNDNPVVLDFDHIDPSLKTESISKIVSGGFSRKKIWDEIAKCEVRCANCHRIRTASQFGWWNSPV